MKPWSGRAGPYRWLAQARVELTAVQKLSTTLSEAAKKARRLTRQGRPVPADLLSVAAVGAAIPAVGEGPRSPEPAGESCGCSSAGDGENGAAAGSAPEQARHPRWRSTTGNRLSSVSM